MPSHAVINVSHLGKRYGSVVAVDDVTLEVHRGEIFGLIGPNGAAKTTTMECVEGLRRPDRGAVSVLGLDPGRDASALRKRIGVQHQEAHLQKRIKVWEALDLWRTLYGRVVDTEALLVQLMAVDGAVQTLRGEGDDFVTEVISHIARGNIRITGFRTVTPTLEDVFLKLTGHAVRD